MSAIQKLIEELKSEWDELNRKIAAFQARKEELKQIYEKLEA